MSDFDIFERFVRFCKDQGVAQASFQGMTVRFEESWDQTPFDPETDEDLSPESIMGFPLMEPRL